MKISKDNMYNYKYTSVLEGKELRLREWTRRLKKFIRKNRIISISMVLFIMCVGMNLILIYNFLKILQMV